MKILVDSDLAETIPDGTFGGPRATNKPKPAHQPWTKAEQDAHWNALCDAVGATRDRRPTA